jgi:coenzyme F420-0:L-glutamate ligase/coenzyme F420-1:gamma-L-glutamate ligase
MNQTISMFSVPNFPLIRPGDDLAQHILQQLRAGGQHLQDGDILVVAQKVVSKAEGRLVKLADVTPSDQARQIAATVDKDPRVIQVILDDSRSIIRVRRNLFVVEQRSGWICANAGVDRSNVQPDEQGDEYLALLPLDADASAARIRHQLHAQSGANAAVLISDSHGRAWRVGTTGICIGCAGLPPIWNQRGLHDLFGYELHSSEECIADELASAASLLMGQSNEGRPVIVIRGYQLPAAPAAPAQTIQRPASMDAFRS